MEDAKLLNIQFYMFHVCSKYMEGWEGGGGVGGWWRGGRVVEGWEGSGGMGGWWINMYLGGGKWNECSADMTGLIFLMSIHHVRTHCVERGDVKCLHCARMYWMSSLILYT